MHFLRTRSSSEVRDRDLRIEFRIAMGGNGQK